MNKHFKKSILIFLFTSLFISCSKDDEPTNKLNEFGVFKLVVTTLNNHESFDLTMTATTSPTTAKITYLNTNKIYSVGPLTDTENNVKIHTVETEDSANRLGCLLDFYAIDGEPTSLAYKIEYFFEDELLYTETKTYNGKYSYQDSFTFTTGEGFGFVSHVTLPVD